MELERRPGLVISPGGIGEVLDLGFNLARRNFRLLVGIALWGLVPGSVLSAVATVAGATGSEPSAGVVVALIGTLIAALITILAEAAACVACGRLIEGGASSDDLSATSLYGAAFERFRWLLLWGLIITIVGVPLVIIAPLGVFVGVRWSVSWTALLLEGRGPIESLRRSWGLTRGSWWHTAMVLLTTSLIIGAISWALLAVVGGVGVALGALVGSDVITALVSALVGIVSGVITTPFTAALAVVLYYELRARAEGFDLELRARQVTPSA